MQSLHKRKPKKKIIIFTIIIIILFVINPFNIVNKTRDGLTVVFKPFFQLSASFGEGISNNINMIFSIRDLYGENQELIKKVTKLESEIALLTNVRNENEELRHSLDVLPKEEFELIGSRIIVRDSLGGNNWITINRGENDGIEVNMAVILGEGIFVGYVDMLEKNSARIKLITNSDSIINVATARTGAEAIARGEHGLSIVAEDIKKTDDIKNGDVLITSDVGDTLPRGLSVGRIQNISSSDDELFQKASVVPLFSISDAQFVFVLKKTL